MRVLIGADLEGDPEVKRSAVEFLIQLGEAAAAARDFTSAEAYFQKALALKPDAGTPVYVHVPAGEFLMGSPEGEGDTNEHAQHSVTLDDYWIMRTEVTNAQYLRCVDAGTCDPPADSNRRYADTQFADQPVTGITWFQARDYANWVGGRLPTEAEWEKACRGTDGRTYPWGNQDPTGELLNFSETGVGVGNTVGSYPKGASPDGALDMAGNVWEWTSSAYVDYPYDPKDGREDPESSKARVLRGGSSANNAYLALRRPELQRPWLRARRLRFSGGGVPRLLNSASGLRSLVGLAARPTVNGSGYKMQGPPGLGIAAPSAPVGACRW
jgi:formylglycine-generating enzyme required for sulfatase activity